MKQEKYQPSAEEIKKAEDMMSPEEKVLSETRENNYTKVRELSPEEFWGGSVSVKNLSEDEFAQKISEVANELNFTYSGYRISESAKGFNYHFSRYPRRAFGPVAPIEKYQEALQKLSEKLDTTGKEEKKSEQPKFRVLLGLEEGYAEHKKRSILEQLGKGEIANIEDAKKSIRSNIGNMLEFGIDIDQFSDVDELKTALENINLGKNHTLEEVKKELGEKFDITQAEIYSAGSWGKYTEPAVIIEGDKSEIQKVYAISEKFRQARIAVEDLQVGQSHMVETKYCEDPDKE